MSAKDMTRRLLKRLPDPFARGAETSLRWLLSLRSSSHRTVRSIYRKIGAPAHEVRQGPFAGMRYLPFMNVTVLPKILGTYELELREFVEEICRNNADLLVNVGAAEGYYSIGFARCRPGMPIISFEMSDRVREDLQRMIRANGVANQVQVRGRCDPQALAEVLAPAQRPVVLCDVEGFEVELLDPKAVPALVRATILLELHEQDRPGVTDVIRKRFEATHSIRSMWSRPRERGDLPPVAATLTDEEFAWAAAEHRLNQQEWFYMVPM